MTFIHAFLSELADKIPKSPPSLSDAALQALEHCRVDFERKNPYNDIKQILRYERVLTKAEIDNIDGKQNIANRSVALMEILLTRDDDDILVVCDALEKSPVRSLNTLGKRMKHENPDSPPSLSSVTPLALEHCRAEFERKNSYDETRQTLRREFVLIPAEAENINGKQNTTDRSEALREDCRRFLNDSKASLERLDSTNEIENINGMQNPADRSVALMEILLTRDDDDFLVVFDALEISPARSLNTLGKRMKRKFEEFKC
ncbi:uncharacterized protein TRIADDRAFT_62689 [Trichoplax adhaerens]|uniref:CARD domain-containing protein n=1 Tax=Trichoplax adhaerens TaxID=10228 RepID=B3SEK0_TRIAD|nr:predicted protein [Trichoplax adhaerens]EDV18844.1 predicted protein [Trichoplax adhaerens]|eukprot:XP_002118669.1 predicted protein [Trichoplax adhaerens]